jgi:hypothetical protein
MVKMEGEKMGIEEKIKIIASALVDLKRIGDFSPKQEEELNAIIKG